MWSTGTMHAMVGEDPPFATGFWWVFADQAAHSVPVDHTYLPSRECIPESAGTAADGFAAESPLDLR